MKTDTHHILDFDQAMALVLEHAVLQQPSSAETLPLLETLNRVLALPVHAERDQPPFDRSTRDGYAVQAASSTLPLKLAGTLRAGELWSGPPLGAGEAIEIMTGAPIPEGADAVLMVEHASLTDTHLTPTRSVESGENIVPQGTEARAGSVVLAPGTCLGPAEIALAAACGQASLTVFHRPRVAILTTGDELVDLDQIPRPEQIRNSNSYALAALVASAGASALRLPVARDEKADLLRLITLARIGGSADRHTRALLPQNLHPEPSLLCSSQTPSISPSSTQTPLPSDLLLLSGGVSMGEYDLVEQVLVELGAEFFFTGVRMQPGRPVVFGRLPAQSPTGPNPASIPESPDSSSHPAATLVSYPTGSITTSSRATPNPDLPAVYFFGLPGNPVSTQVTFQVFAETFLRAQTGARETVQPEILQNKTSTSKVQVGLQTAGSDPTQTEPKTDRPAAIPRPRFVQATLTEDVAGKANLTRLLPALFTPDPHRPTVSLIGWQGSGDVAANARANAYALFPPSTDPTPANTVITVLLR